MCGTPQVSRRMVTCLASSSARASSARAGAGRLKKVSANEIAAPARSRRVARPDRMVVSHTCWTSQNAGTGRNCCSRSQPPRAAGGEVLPARRRELPHQGVLVHLVPQGEEGQQIGGSQPGKRAAGTFDILSCGPQEV